MAMEELISMHGLVREVLPGLPFRGELDNGYKPVDYSAGCMRKHPVRILAGDSVSLEPSPDDLSKARITFHHLERRTPGATTPGGHAR